ncbi:MAG TPA: SDR family oxidoreductase [Candidatus Binatia bacterium]|jgi:NAD(P)-dependent dehydrogenase (short-subunit alcohol dehydrogenase family)|nr:SDR family oxidoreductase [Candidatus Binatia bacterium]
MQIGGRVALITGGKRVGAVVAEELAARGADIALTFNRSRTEAETTATAVRALGRRAFVRATDVRDADACAAAVDDTVQALGRLDVLVNMASLYVQKPFDTLTVADWDEQLAIDLRATFLCARAAVPHMRDVGGGRIINVTDWVAASGRPRYVGYLPYYVAKAGVVALTEALALELANDQILVNAIAPGPIVAPPDLDARTHDAIRQATPLGRWGGEMEIAKAVIALIDGDYITGETIRVDGGRHLR